jgi:HEAT repeat protein
MNIIVDRLSLGDLRSDGDANDVVADVLAHPELFELLLEGLDSRDDAVRGHAADALEKVSRVHPDWLAPYLSLLTGLALEDPVAMVRWHLAMVLGTLAVWGPDVELIVPVLSDLLDDRSAFVRSWAIAMLTWIGTERPEWRGEIVPRIGDLRADRSVAVRGRVGKALQALQQGVPMPVGWVKANWAKRA